MFEQEVELEKRESSVVPLLLIVAMIILIVGTAGYFVWQNRQVLSTADAGNAISTVLRDQGPATVRFHVGMVKPSVAEKPEDPHYRLLEKAGIVKLGKSKDRVYPVALTMDGEKLLAQIPDVSKTKEKDGTDVYVVPLAERRLVEVSKVTMNSPTRATVVYSWKWEPNRLGNLFDASGSLVKSFNTWDRATLIDKYGVDFYHGDPTKVQIVLSKPDRGPWQPFVE
ncbi:MAG TPA: hypothetical protein VMT53_21565 [Terriglobales bacterium]|nr:hypothetical protein [Terriglobales bacterium]